MERKELGAGSQPSAAPHQLRVSHTPGPWHFVPENAGLMSDHGYGILFGEPDSWGWEKNLYVSVGCSGNVRRALGEGVAEANARLIAAAPDLRAVAERVITVLYERAGPDNEHLSDAEFELWNAARAALSKAGARHG